MRRIVVVSCIISQAKHVGTGCVSIIFNWYTGSEDMIYVWTRSFSFIGMFFSVYLLFGTTVVHGALLYFNPAEVNVYRGDTVTLDLRLDTDEGECINTVDAVIHYDPSVRAVDVSRGDSILNLWVESPVIDEVAHTITFAGGIPGGYCGRIPGDPSLTNVLLELVFRSPGFTIGAGENPSARVWIDESSQVLLHDGLGSNANVRLQDSKIMLLAKAGDTPTDTWRDDVQGDTELPADFAITLTKDGAAFSGKYFVTFNSVDKQSGIDHYEIMEEPFSEFKAFKWGRADAPWITTESPYVLIDQTLNSTIRIKAIDKAGNERIATLVPDMAIRSMSKDMLITASIVGGFIVLIISLVTYALWRRNQRILMESNSSHE